MEEVRIADECVEAEEGAEGVRAEGRRETVSSLEEERRVRRAGVDGDDGGGRVDDGGRVGGGERAEEGSVAVDESAVEGDDGRRRREGGDEGRALACGGRTVDEDWGGGWEGQKAAETVVFGGAGGEGRWHGVFAGRGGGRGGDGRGGE